MRKTILLFICLISGTILVVAQSSPKKEWTNNKITHTVSPPIHDYPFTGKEFDYGILLGAANSMTDIGNGTQKFSDIQFKATNISAGVYLRYRFLRHFGASCTINYGRITGNDSLSPNNGPYGKYKDFENNIFEFALRGEFYFARKEYKMGKVRERKNNFYLFGGIAGFYNLPVLTISMYGSPKAPTTITTGGSTRIDNQSIYDTTTRITYTPGFNPTNYCFSIPVGFGINHTFHNSFRIGLDMGYRFAFTDYLDGFISSNNTKNDSYIFTNITFGYVIKYADNFSKKFQNRKYNKRYYW